MSRAAVTAIVTTLALTHAAAAQDATVGPAQIVAGFVDARLGRDRLVAAPAAPALGYAAVFVTATADALMVYDQPVRMLDHGRVAQADIARCAMAAPCVPALRDAIARERAVLAGATRRLPDVLLIVDRDVPYGTLMLMARSAAAAGAALSLRIVLRAGDRLGALPVWVAPGEPIAVNGPSKPALIRAELGPRDIEISASPYYADGIERVRAREELLTALSRLQIASGRLTLVIAAPATAPAGRAIAVLADAREVLPFAVLADAGSAFARIER